MIRIRPDLDSLVTLGVATFDGLELGHRAAALDRALAEAERAVRARPPGGGLLVRRMYSRVGLDPTRRRPSSEALLRRVLKGEPLPHINPIIDVCNWCSMEFQLPYGVYDLDCVGTEVELRLGLAGEQYAGIGKDTVHVGGRLVLADPSGPFGNPSSDSARTMVTPTTRRALAVIFAPIEAGSGTLEQALEATRVRAHEFAGARAMATAIVSVAAAR